MLKTPVWHPEILAALGAAGHASKILITDGNYPHSTKPNPTAKYVYANFMAGVVDGPTALKMVCHLVPIEKAEVMEPMRTGQWAMKDNPPIWKTYAKILREQGDFSEALIPLQKPQFNEQAVSRDVCLVIASAETAIYANILITIGAIRP